MFVLKDYDNTFSEQLDKTKKYIKFVLSLQYIAGLAAILLLFLIPRALPAFMMSATTFYSSSYRVWPDVCTDYNIFLRKPRRLIKSALDGIINNASAAAFTVVLASLLLLSKPINAKLP